MSTNWEAVLKGDLDELHRAVYERTADQRDDPSSREQEYADVIMALCQRCRSAEAAASGLADALREVGRRASLPVTPKVNGLPETEETAASAIAECVRLALAHVAQPVAGALRSWDEARAKGERGSTP
jgi:hypothetical protein